MLLISPDRPQHDGVDRLSVSHGVGQPRLFNRCDQDGFFVAVAYTQGLPARPGAREGQQRPYAHVRMQDLLQGSLGKIRAEHRFGPARHAERRDGFTVRQAVEKVAFLFLHQHQVSIEQAPIERVEERLIVHGIVCRYTGMGTDGVPPYAEWVRPMREDAVRIPCFSSHDVHQNPTGTFDANSCFIPRR